MRIFRCAILFFYVSSFSERKRKMSFLRRKFFFACVPHEKRALLFLLNLAFRQSAFRHPCLQFGSVFRSRGNVNLPRLKSRASLSVRPEGPRKRKMTPHPCTQRAPDGFPDRLTAACSCGRLGCAGGWGRHAGYPAIWEAASASLYVARVTLVLFAASGTFAVTRDQPSFPRLDSRSRMR